MLDVNFKAVKVPKIAAWPFLCGLQFLRPVMKPASTDNRNLAQKTQNLSSHGETSLPATPHEKQPRKTFVKNLIAVKKIGTIKSLYQ